MTPVRKVGGFSFPHLRDDSLCSLFPSIDPQALTIVCNGRDHGHRKGSRMGIAAAAARTQDQAQSTARPQGPGPPVHRLTIRSCCPTSLTGSLGSPAVQVAFLRRHGMAITPGGSCVVRKQRCKVVFAAPAGGATDALCHDQTSILLSGNIVLDRDAIFRSLGHLLQDTDLLTRTGLAARRHSGDRFQFDRNLRKS